jgi:hypothetical protein
MADAEANLKNALSGNSQTVLPDPPHEAAPAGSPDDA